VRFCMGSRTFALFIKIAQPSCHLNT